MTYNIRVDEAELEFLTSLVRVHMFRPWGGDTEEDGVVEDACGDCGQSEDVHPVFHINGLSADQSILLAQLIVKMDWTKVDHDEKTVIVPESIGVENFHALSEILEFVKSGASVKEACNLYIEGNNGHSES